MMRQQPLIVGHSSTLAQPGDYLAHDDSGVPIIVVRQGDARAQGIPERLPASRGPVFVLRARAIRNCSYARITPGRIAPMGDWLRRRVRRFQISNMRRTAW